MAEVGFYHLQSSRLEHALPRLLEKIVSLGHNIVVLAGSSERVKVLNEQLWTFDDRSWLPHGTREDGHGAAQPVYLTTAEENPNQANVLVCIDGVRPDYAVAFERVVDMFDGRDDEAVAQARKRWQDYRQGGLDLTYWQQRENGGWEQKA
jgi:DNA polymerase-3 subunit chi